MSTRAKSPVRLVCKTAPKFVQQITRQRRKCNWTCDAPFSLALFLARDGSQQRLVVHRSARRPGVWQSTYFFGEQATGHEEAKTCNEALREVYHRRWKLAQVLDEQGRPVVPRGPVF